MKKSPCKNKEEQPVTTSRTNITKLWFYVALFLTGISVFLSCNSSSSNPEQMVSGHNTSVSQNRAIPEAPNLHPEIQVEDGKDVETGLVAGEGLQIVKGTCTACHSSALILQSRFTREEWHDKIVWMQETQGLWDLGDNEAVILDYLEAHYGPEEFKGRRRPLGNIEWYQLKD